MVPENAANFSSSKYPLSAQSSLSNALLSVKKISKQVLSRCEWGHDDYSLKVENLPKAPPPPPKVDKRGQMDLI